MEMDTETVVNKISYKKAQNYWKSIDATVNGMLGGFEVLTETDCKGSLQFIKEFTSGSMETKHACGRVTLKCFFQFNSLCC
jgi:hypothetical protein